jgi:nucleotide-binding universal stress UspA family protein
MKTYRRILVSIAAGGETEILLQRAVALTHGHQAQLLVVRVLDTRGGFEPDGPAASLRGDALARRVPETKRRLDLLLAQNNLSWAEAKVVWGVPQAELVQITRTWKPDLVVACDGHLLREIANGADTLNVGRRNWFSRLFGRLPSASASAPVSLPPSTA